jgi:hypothetical protein
MKPAIRFVRNEQDLGRALESLKQTPCPHCGRVGTLNRHDRLKGNDPEAADKQRERGCRAWCSNRGRRGGCGRTVAMLFEDVLPRHSLRAGTVGKVLAGLCGGHSIQAAWEQSGCRFSLQSVYHLLQRFRRRLGAVRTALHSRGPPPASTHRDPLRQSAEHLRGAFPGASCPVAAFQYVMQAPLMG